MTIRYILEVMYDGTCFHGSQVQGLTPTVQLSVNNTLSTLLRQPVSTTGASRTDEGVHALCNFYHFDTDQIPAHDFIYKCNAILPAGLAAVKLWRATSPTFNARFDASQRTYRYRIYHKKNPFLVNRALFYPFPLSLDALSAAAGHIREQTYFESFAKRNMQSKTFNCIIAASEWEQHQGELHYIVTANRFLRGMVRGLVATQLKVARDGGGLPQMAAIFQAANPAAARFNVPGFGLYLEKITYPDGLLEPFQDH
jgi:tRNA pseudouridine38-40 synthase